MISARNYAAQAVAGMRAWENLKLDYLYRADDIDMSKRIRRSIESAVHFAIPDNGVIMADRLRGIRDMPIRLPYKMMTIEYWVDPNFSKATKQAETHSGKRLILCFEQSRENVRDHMEILEGVPPTANSASAFRSAYEENDTFVQIIALQEVNGVWVPSPMGWLLPSAWDKAYEGSSVVDQLSGKPPDTSQARVTGTPLAIFRGLAEMVVQRFGAEEAFKMAVHDITIEVAAVLEMIEALSCRNVSEDTLQEENRRANPKRIKAGKLPIWETKTLVVDTRQSRQSGGESSVTVHDRASPRQHLRRGHIRRLPSGNVWVQSCVVGSASQGRIDKQYNIK